MYFSVSESILVFSCRPFGLTLGSPYRNEQYVGRGVHVMFRGYWGT